MGCTNIKQARLSQNVPQECDLNLQIDSDRQNHIIVNHTKCGKTMIFQRKIIYPDEQLENTSKQIDSQSYHQNTLILALQNKEINQSRMSHSIDTTIQDFTPKGILSTQQSKQFSTMSSAKKVTFKIDYFQECSRNSQNYKSKHMKRRKTTMKIILFNIIITKYLFQGQIIRFDLQNASIILQIIMGCNQGLDSSANESNYDILISDQHIDAQITTHQAHLQNNTVFHQKAVFPEPEINQTYEKTDNKDPQSTNSVQFKQYQTKMSSIKPGTQRPSVESQQSMMGLLHILHNYNPQNNHNNHNLENIQKNLLVETKRKPKQKKSRINMADLEQLF
ncbi:hypothetical protein pb186bvf_002825 [Paramecium bursaria]